MRQSLPKPRRIKQRFPVLILAMLAALCLPAQQAVQSSPPAARAATASLQGRLARRYQSPP